MKTGACSLILLPILFILSACGATDAASDLGSCQVDFYKTTKPLTSIQEQDFRYSCMRSKGYAYAEGDVICKAMVSSGFMVENCFYKPSVIGEVKRFLTK